MLSTPPSYETASTSNELSVSKRSSSDDIYFLFWFQTDMPCLERHMKEQLLRRSNPPSHANLEVLKKSPEKPGD